ncbi:hypothetical protein E2562_014748 [Oryza meyeriana var. granulata]|uniref:Uncharacterized protein n=1 Tax=Oryza meyeriana var. granulata TaxID=110450 RepID=A0A6G1BM87_9ORYZ|nr:hypothetical protein E2562_014748 [Oryza meyeriana var. granulata]
MAAALPRVFPSTFQLCRSYILDRHSDVLNIIFAKDKEIEGVMMLCVNQTYTPVEFETAWVQFLERFNLHGCATLQHLLDLTHQ